MEQNKTSAPEISNELKNSNAWLQWQTAAEENGNRFNIQRSKDGINFYDIGEVKAAGNIAAIQTYNYTDPAVVKLGAPKLFYRLEEVDNDGKTEKEFIVVDDAGTFYIAQIRVGN
jgi:hypothetical protein